jgi:hypothetical protein
MNSHRRRTRKSRRRARAALLDSRAVRKHQSLTGRKGSVQERKPPSKKALGLRSTVQAPQAPPCSGGWWFPGTLEGK